MTRPPRVFISYAHGSTDHTEAVRNLWILLRRNGIDARLDLPAAQHRQDWPRWMADQVRDADHILIIASPTYRARAEHRTTPEEGRGVQWETRLITEAFYRNQRDLDRFVPVILPGQSADGIPDYLTPTITNVYEVKDFTLTGAEPLIRLLTKQPAEVDPTLGSIPSLPPRDHTLTTPETPLVHRVDLHLTLDPDHGIRTQILLAGTLLGEHTAYLPAGLLNCWADVDSPTGPDRLITLGKALWHSLVDEPTGHRLIDLIDHSPVGRVIDLVVHLPDDLTPLPIELLRLPDARLLATIAGVRTTRRLSTVDFDPTPPLPGPLKILAAVATPDESLDVEAEMQSLLDAVTNLDLDSDEAKRAQVRILEVASLPEISKALKADRYHVLHLYAHGSPDGIELEDEDGNPVHATVDKMIDALNAGKHRVPLVVLSSCRGASGGTEGLAASLVRHGADRVIAMQTTVTAKFATDLARELYQELANDPHATVAQALADARYTVTSRLLEAARNNETPPRPESSIPTLVAAGEEQALRDPSLPEVPLRRFTLPPQGTGVRELPIGHLIGRRAELRTAMSVLRRNAQDRERLGDRSGLALTGIGGIGKTALAGRILARAREQGWLIAEHVGSWTPPTLITACADALDTGHPDVAKTLRDPRVEDTTKLNIVFTALAKLHLLVLFDDFEQNLTPDGKFTDPGFAEIFHILCQAAEAGRVLVTCRYPIPSMETTLLRIDLPALSPAELGRLFLRLPALRDLSPDDRRLISRTIGGHPRLIEFLDVLLRQGDAALFRHVTKKLHKLAKDEDLDLTPTRDLKEGISDAARLGSRDILIDALYDQLTDPQRELFLQAAISQAPFALVDLAHTQHGPESTRDQLTTIRQDTERLVDLTLLSPSPPHEFIVHPWVATALTSHHTTDSLIARHQRAAEMRRHRINTARGGFYDIVEFIRHLASSRQYDRAIAATFQACDLVGGGVAVSALLADTVPLIPTNHRDYIALVDRECQALLAIGLASATVNRYEKLLELAEERVVADPDNAQYQDSLGVIYERLGDLALTTGDTTAATDYYRNSLAISEHLATTDPNNAQYQRDLSISHNKLGDLALAVGNNTTASQHYRTALATRERLATADPNNTEYQRDLGSSHDRLGDLALAIGDTTTAGEHCRSALAIAERLAATDPNNTDHQRDLSVSHDKLGDIARSTGDAPTASRHHRTALTIRERLATTDPNHALYQRDLGISHDKLGDLALGTGDSATAIQHYRTALTIRERLATTDPNNTNYQRDLSISHGRLGDIARGTGDIATAAQHYHADLAIAERLAVTDPRNAQYQRDLSISYNKLGDLARSTGDIATAAQHYRTALTIRERLATADPNNAQYERDLSYTRSRLDDLAGTGGEVANVPPT